MMLLSEIDLLAIGPGYSALNAWFRGHPEAACSSCFVAIDRIQGAGWQSGAIMILTDFCTVVLADS